MRLKSIGAITFILIIYHTAYSYQPNFGCFFSLGPGFNTNNIDTWINTYHLGPNMGLELKIKTNYILRWAYNPETAENSNNTIFIENTEWPKGMAINFNSIQYLLGYSININKISVIPLIGISQSYFDTPYRFEPEYNPIDNPQPKNRVYKTGYSLGPMAHISFRYNKLFTTKPTEVFGVPIPQINFLFFPYFDAGYIIPLFDKNMDSYLKGHHYYFKIGVGTYFLYFLSKILI